MKIECLKPGTDITIDASDGTKNLSFASSVLEVTENDREYLKQVRVRLICHKFRLQSSMNRNMLLISRAKQRCVP